MKRDTFDVIVLALLCCISGALVGWGVTRDEIRHDAVRSGAAHWVSDEDGAAKFEWIDGRAAAQVRQ